MKKWISFLIFSLILSLCTACTKAPSGQWSIAEKSSREFINALQIQITELDQSENRVTYKIENPSTDTYCCGTDADFSLEVLHKGVWHKMDHEPGWAITLELHILKPGESKEFTPSLWSELPLGTYRLVKGVSLEESSQDKELICCEFVIE